MPSFPDNQIKLLCDENIPRKVVELLNREKGLDVKQAPFGWPDEKVAELAKSEQRILITYDKHFRNIFAYPPKEYYGIVFIKIRPPLIKTTLSALLNLFNLVSTSEFKGELFILLPIGFRVFPKEPLQFQ